MTTRIASLWDNVVPEQDELVAIMCKVTDMDIQDRLIEGLKKLNLKHISNYQRCDQLLQSGADAIITRTLEWGKKQ